MALVWLARYCGKMYSCHIFSYCGLPDVPKSWMSGNTCIVWPIPQCYPSQNVVDSAMYLEDAGNRRNLTSRDI